MGRKVDVEDLVDATAVAELLGLSTRNAVSVYRQRYRDFPEPVFRHGTCLLWVRQEITHWARSRPSQG